MSEQKVKLKFHGSIWADPETKSNVSYCSNLDIFSGGKTVTEAKKALESACLLFLEECFKRNLISIELDFSNPKGRYHGRTKSKAD